MPAQPACIQNDSRLSAANQLYAAGDYAEALAAYRRQLPAHPQAYLVHFAMANSLVQLGRHEEAIGLYLLALQAQPDLRPACMALADTFFERRMFEPAVNWYQHARSLDEEATDGNLRLGTALVSLDQADEAAEIFCQWYRQEPDNPFAAYLSQAVLNPAAVTIASPAYVRALFDEYAPRFDHSLSGLEYRGPALLEEALRKINSEAAPSWRVLDAGCGTGWVGQQLQPYAKHLVGVDLSPEMIQQSRLRDVYQELVCEDLVAYLEQEEADFDVIAASDTLTYIGDLTPFCAAASRRLAEGGLLAVNTEAVADALAPQGYCVQPTGRFGHTRWYLQQCLEQVGMELVHAEQDVLRQQCGRDVACWVVVGRRPAGVPPAFV